MYALELVYVVIMYTHRTIVLLWCSGLCDNRVLFMYNVCQLAWRIAPIRFNNVSLCPSIFIPNISGLLRRSRVKPGPSACQLDALTTTLPAPLVMKFLSVGTIEVGLQSTHVHNSCLKWHRIHILFLIHSPLYMVHSTLR